MARPKSTSTNTNTTKKTTTTAKKTETKKVVEKKDDIIEEVKEENIVNEKETLKKQNEELVDIIKQMKEEINNLKTVQPNIIVQQNGNSDLTRTVKVTSLMNNTLVLTTMPNGKGNAFTFEKYGDTLNIKFTEIQSVLQSHSNMFEDGLVVLENEKDYEDLGIGYLYGKVLSKKEMDKVLSLEEDEDIDIILEMSDTLLDSTLRKISENINNGVNYNYNRIKVLQDETDLKMYINLAE